MPQPGGSGSRSGDPEIEGTDMEIINGSKEGKGVIEGHVSCPVITETQQTYMELSKEKNKEGEVIQMGINDKKCEILGEQLFCVPIIEAETSQHPKPRDLQPKPHELHLMNQARDAVTGTKEKQKQRAETKLNATT